jgi:hypothetical protein
MEGQIDKNARLGITMYAIVQILLLKVSTGRLHLFVSKGCAPVTEGAKNHARVCPPAAHAG